jgi:asparagine synthetase B (glutamine-hydrolysing)
VSNVDTGAQPLVSQTGKVILAVNGEIYNHIKLKSICSDYKLKTHSDCEVIIPLVGLISLSLLVAITDDYPVCEI